LGIPLENALFLLSNQIQKLLNFLFHYRFPEPRETLESIRDQLLPTADITPYGG
jgi:hypothetical protein